MIDESKSEVEDGGDQMGDLIPFGIACFHFGIAKEPPFRYSNQLYITELNKVLASIPNIEKISITDIDISTSPQDISEKIPDLCEEGGFFPNLFSGKIEFILRIPRRIQQQTMPFINLDTGAEQFKILINYFYHMPVTFVVPLDPAEECSPANAVIVVRKFLENQFLNIKSEYIKFEYLGPSPFHAECYIKPSIRPDRSTPGVTSLNITTEMGYDEIIFDYDTQIFKNEQNAEACIFKKIIPELAFFYGIQRMRVTKLRKWGQIEELLDNIIPKNIKKDNLERLREFISYSGKIKKLFVAIAIFEKDLIFIKEEILNDYKDIYSDRWDSYFQDFIDKAMKEDETYPTNQLIQLLNYLESNRAKNMELLTMFFSAIVGGIIGALITLFFTYQQ